MLPAHAHHRMVVEVAIGEIHAHVRLIVAVLKVVDPACGIGENIHDIGVDEVKIALKRTSDGLANYAAIIINMSGRGDKDIFTIAQAFQDPSWQRFIIEKGEQYKEEAGK